MNNENRIQLSFDSKSYTDELTKIESQKELLKKSKQIKIELKVKDSSDLIEQKRKLTKIENVELLLQASNVTNEYNILKEAEKINLEPFETNETEITIKSEFKEALKQKYTTYLKPEDEALYRKLQHIAERLNEVGSAQRYLQYHSGSWHVNKIMLNSKM